MGTPRPLSLAARSLLRSNSLVFGVLLLVVWLPAALEAWPTGSGGSGTLEGVLAVLLLLPGALLLLRGVRGAVAARRFNRLDSAFADALAGSLDRLWRTPPLDAYLVDDQMAEVRNAHLVEIERHFDRQTVGAVQGSLHHQLRLFGASVTRTYGAVAVGGLAGAVQGLSGVDLTVTSTTRDNLMGDALFAVFEATGPAGDRDTYRVVSMSGPAAASWIDGLLVGAARGLGETRTHAGTMVLSWRGNLVAQFQPRDISYLTDRLKALAARPYAERDPLVLRGPLIGRNALMAAHVQIGSGEPLMVLPVRFPVLFGEAVGRAAEEADQKLPGRPQQALGGGEHR